MLDVREFVLRDNFHQDTIHKSEWMVGQFVEEEQTSLDVHRWLSLENDQFDMRRSFFPN